MSKIMVGNLKSPNSYQRHGKRGQIKRVPINIPSIDGQRPTLAATAEKLLKKAGGFREELFSPVLAAEIEEEEITLLVDGDHRRHMLQISDPSEREIDAWVVRCKNLQEANDIFEQTNKSRKTPIKAEDIFFNSYASGKKETLDMAAVLTAMGFRITSSPQDRTGAFSVGDQNGPAIACTTFKKAYDDCESDFNPMYCAANLINSKFKSEEKVKSELFSGLVCFYKTYYKQLFTSKGAQTHSAKEFEKWFKAFVPNQSRATFWKKLGGNVDNYRAESVCIGMLDDFINSGMPSKTTLSSLKIQRVVELIPKV